MKSQTLKFHDVPLKINGKKTKLLSWISENLPENFNDFYEPFAGSCVVGANLSRTNCFFNDINPHIIEFHKFVTGEFGTRGNIKNILSSHGELLELLGDQYYKIRRRDFNNGVGNIGDFLFLTRACFNGLVRFNSKGGFNTPYCKDDKRFTEQYIDKVTDICANFREKSLINDWRFTNVDFEQVIEQAKKGDLIYCDPPYFGLHATYFDIWTEESEERLSEALKNSPAYFILSTWKSNGVKENPMLEKHWGGFDIVEKKHRHQIGAKAESRREVTEVLIKNF